MTAARSLIELAARRVEAALASWQHITAQCEEAKRKLLMLQQHGESYRNLLRSALAEGMSATATMTYLGFIGQIEAVVANQESEIGRLEQACARKWQALVETRREKRMYEILGERAAARRIAAEDRRRLAEIDELLQRVGPASP
jgi:flagellar export protein FliJ